MMIGRNDQGQVMAFWHKLLFAVVVATTTSFMITTMILNSREKLTIGQTTQSSAIYSRTTGATANRQNSLQLSAKSGTLIIDRIDFASQIPGALETPDGIAKVRENHKPAFVLYGPYWPLTPGQYKGGMEITFGPFVPDSATLCRLDVVSGSKVLSQLEIDAPTAKRKRLFTLPFTMEHGVAHAPIELRLWCGGLADLLVENAFFVRQ
jgi:hypothetical protein